MRLGGKRLYPLNDLTSLLTECIEEVPVTGFSEGKPGGLRALQSRNQAESEEKTGSQHKD